MSQRNLSQMLTFLTLQGLQKMGHQKKPSLSPQAFEAQGQRTHSYGNAAITGVLYTSVRVPAQQV